MENSIDLGRGGLFGLGSDDVPPPEGIRCDEEDGFTCGHADCPWCRGEATFPQ